jgi:hypothetical protein
LCQRHTFRLLLLIVVHIIRGDLVQEFDIVIRVELSHFTLRRWFCALVVEKSELNGMREFLAYVYLHLLVEPVIHDQGVCHPHTRWLHSRLVLSSRHAVSMLSVTYGCPGP